MPKRFKALKAVKSLGGVPGRAKKMQRGLVRKREESGGGDQNGGGAQRGDDDGSASSDDSGSSRSSSYTSGSGSSYTSGSSSDSRSSGGDDGRNNINSSARRRSTATSASGESAHGDSTSRDGSSGFSANTEGEDGHDAGRGAHAADEPRGRTLAREPECAVDEGFDDAEPVHVSRRKASAHLGEIEELLKRAERNDATLTRIELRNRNLTDEEIIPLLDVLPYTKSLRALNVENNKVGDRGASALAGALAENSSVVSVNLGGNLIGDAGASDLFRVLSSSNDSVTELSLSSNAISDAAATELASALLDNESLVAVDLSHNEITNDGARDLLKVVGINETLETLALEGNADIDDELWKEVRRALEEEGEETESASEADEPLAAKDIGADEGEDGGALTGGEAMLQDMPDEDDAQLAKRQLIQQIMRDSSLTPAEKSKKMQDVMAGKVELPKVETKEPPVTEAPKEKSGTEVESEGPASPGGSDGDANAAESSNAARPAAMVKANATQKAPLGQEASANVSTNAIAQPPKSGGKRQSTVVSARNAIAAEWKRRMMAVHPRAHDNLLDVLLAHQYRLSLQSPPKQSFFRVVALVFFSRIGADDGVRRDERYHVAGTNDEPHSVGGSICAERAALMQLRFVPDLEQITKIVIVTDEVDAISPGMLCREFMASHDRISWDMPIVLGRSVCRKCGFTLSGKVCGDADAAENEDPGGTKSKVFATCEVGHEEAKNKDYPTPHDFVGTVTTLRDLFPYPSLYTRLTSREALRFGEDYVEKSSRSKESNGEKDETSVLSHISEGNEGGSAASNGSSQNEEDVWFTSQTTVSRRKEPGSSLVKDGRSSMSSSLRETIDFMRQVREERHDMNASGSIPGTLDHLTAPTLRISSRLKPSQRREKLIRLATEVTAMESHQKHAHPIQYGAAVLFSDGTVAIASQKLALEYGCTLDAVGQLASAILSKGLQIEEDGPPCRPVLLVQCDQFGIAHAPFAQGRAFLTERGYGSCKVLVHQKRKAPNGKDAAGDGAGESGDAINLRLLEVEANDLAPAPPDIFGSLITKNHAQSGGLQIQF
ncbi:hypothetical protein ACHAXT_008955 [Thalassiosira profunda]